MTDIPKKPPDRGAWYEGRGAICSTKNYRLPPESTETIKGYGGYAIAESIPSELRTLISYTPELEALAYEIAHIDTIEQLQSVKENAERIVRRIEG